MRDGSTILALKEYATVRRRGIEGLESVEVPWSVENVMGARATMLREVQAEQIMMLCGTMYGHRVFRHRLVAFSHPVEQTRFCKHTGKYVGDNAPCYNYALGNPTRTPNMYTPYSRRSARHGSMDELHDAMGFPSGSFSYQGLVQGLPSGYGIHIASLLASLSSLFSPMETLKTMRSKNRYVLLLCQTFTQS